MQFVSRKNLIVASLTKRFIRAGKTVKTKTKEGDKNLFLISALADDLVETEYKTDDILNAIKEDSYQSEWEPRLCRIIEILRQDEERKIECEIEKKWLYFLDHAIRPTRYGIELENWAYDIARSLSIGSRHITDNEIPWIKKDFIQIVSRQIRGDIEVFGKSSSWQQIEGSKKLVKNDEPALIGSMFKNKLKIG